MNKLFKIAKATVLSVVLALCLHSQALSRNAQQQPVASGDTVWVVVNHVKPDIREQFERFVYETFWPASKKLNSNAQRAFNHTRVLNPVGPEEDGTYTYVFLMDPVISGEDYHIDSLLRKMYSEQEANAYYKQFEETLARGGEVYVVVQSQLLGGRANR
ncbi:hypothetical protein POKO110462_02440 [Pontibacter korlensis]|uniref:Uncharacterized protein n=1 Tax=Pontibacter korlensis TaxID=400092 RepID=A0A0E3ZGU7_9BACT|nr:hypothetical protein [Pontibacter korlensis]AKD03673.1 hypothetical protein PKOR_11715 [Pontibacter korlensis]